MGAMTGYLIGLKKCSQTNPGMLNSNLGLLALRPALSGSLPFYLTLSLSAESVKSCQAYAGYDLYG